MTYRATERSGTAATGFLVAFLCVHASVPAYGTEGDLYGYRNQCGVYAMQVAIDSLRNGPDRDLRLRDDESPLSLFDLQQMATEQNLPAKTVNWSGTTPSFPYGRSPAVIPVVDYGGRRHFVTLLESRSGHFLVADFPNPPIWVAHAYAVEVLKWDGSALHLAASEGDLPQTATGLWRMWGALASGCLLVGVGGLWASKTRMAGAKVTSRVPGFTLIELIVAMGVIATLSMLLLPAVQSARERARAITCRANLRQIGIAVAGYESAHGRLPPSYPGLGIHSNPRDPGSPLTRVTYNQSVFTRVLPFLGYEGVYASLRLDGDFETTYADEPASSAANPAALRTMMPVLLCSSDPAAGAGGVSYRSCEGTSPGGWMMSPSKNDPNGFYLGAFFAHGRRMCDISDGLSYTSFFSEKLCGDARGETYTPWRDVATLPVDLSSPDAIAKSCSLVPSAPAQHHSYGGSAWLFGGFAHTWYNHILGPNAEVPDCSRDHGVSGGAFTARSLHHGGVHIATGDGAVHFASDSVDSRVWRALGSAAGAEAVDAF